MFDLELLATPDDDLVNETFDIFFWVNGGTSSSNTNYKGELLALFDGNFYVINDCS